MLSSPCPERVTFILFFQTCLARSSTRTPSPRISHRAAQKKKKLESSSLPLLRCSLSPLCPVWWEIRQKGETEEVKVNHVRSIHRIRRDSCFALPRLVSRALARSLLSRKKHRYMHEMHTGDRIRTICSGGTTDEGAE
nr:hypothetical protein CFP56_16242 [Quercus suber]